jgi:type II secretion system protein N
METKASNKWIRWIGYPVFFLVAFIFSLSRTLPFAAIQSRAVEEARKAGYTLSIVSLSGAGLFGVTAKGVAVSPIPREPPPADAPPPPGMVIDQITARPMFFPPGVKFSAKAFGGEAEGSVVNRSKAQNIELTLSKLDVSRIGLKTITGVDLTGSINGSGTLVIPQDFPKTTGVIKLKAENLAVNGGTVNYIDLPKVNLGNLDFQIKAESGKATLETLAVSGGDLEGKGEGDITLNSRPTASNIKIKLAFKPNEEWLKKNSFIQMGLSAAGHPDGKGFYTATLDGMLGNPRPALR